MTVKRKNISDKSRAGRLKAALRENLLRRKAQERGRGQAEQGKPAISKNERG